jgi:hypothetical protein
MLHKIRFFVSPIAILILAGTIAPAAVAAGPVGNLAHPYFAAKSTKEATVQIKLHNKGAISQDVKVNDKVYTIKPNASITIKAPAGTQVYAATAGASHKSGDVLFAIGSQLDGETVSFN